MEKTTVLLGASPNPERYSNRAIRKLIEKDIPVFAIGNREFEEGNISIRKGTPHIDEVHTVTLYLNARNQEPYYDYILSLKPKRVIFNPGAMNEDFARILRKNDIEVVTDCMLAMLVCGQF
jgi:predicted CoA-binding protein